MNNVRLTATQNRSGGAIIDRALRVGNTQPGEFVTALRAASRKAESRS